MIIWLLLCGLGVLASSALGVTLWAYPWGGQGCLTRAVGLAVLLAFSLALFVTGYAFLRLLP